ncbi:MAG: VWA domain-containing protein [Actinomycetota bacterium]|nr:VWA domain-containing protein [Actinomycetota bacterium]
MADGPLPSLVALGRDLRGRGLPVGTGRILTFVRGVEAIGLTDRTSLYWTARATMVASRADLDTFDDAFDAWFLTLRSDGEPELSLEFDLPPDPEDLELGEGLAGDASAISTVVGPQQGDGEPAEGDETALRLVASAVEILRTKSFAYLTEDERQRVARLIRELTIRAPIERTRRMRAANKGATLDVRRTLRRSLRTQGEPFDRAWRARRTRTRPLVLILDVSGSMAPYSRALLQFGYAAMAAGRRVEVFCFGTRLTRVTRVLRTKDPDRAMHEIGRIVADWEGGTRIGESLKSLLDGWSQRAALRGAVVVLCSDGLERGDPDLLRRQMARLRRLAYRVVWANPLKGSPRYEPLARGMAAALPSVDVFLSGHNLESLEALAAALAP